MVDSDAALEPHKLSLDLDELDRQTTVTLNYGAHVGFIRGDGSFYIPDVPRGLYILEVTSINYTYDRLWIDVEGVDNIRAAVHLPGTDYEYNPIYSIPYPLELAARAKTDYFTPREGFSIVSILGNPMFLMMAFMVFGVWVLPKLQEGIPPEELEKVRKEQAQMLNANPLGKLVNAAQANR